VYTDFFKQAFIYLFEKVGLPDGIWIYEDLGYKNGLFASPKVLSELIFPYYKELVDFFHGYNLPVVLHSCGSTAQALPLIVDAGFDALNPMERKAKDNDPFIFAEKYGDKLAFIGGLDTRVFETNDREIIRREITAYIEGMKARGARLVFASDHSISTNTRYDTYLYALDVYREHMMY
jgi:uroporphyrinogen decarboxylase